MIVLIPLAVCLIGVVMFLISKNNPDAKEIGKTMMWTGMLVTLLQVGPQVAKLFPAGGH